ncbi:P-loop containing nucleoside triphosphate hydrolase protein [Cercophora scortea]|uniref:P-loop containing nucleoside triphosphate hydrolase protein n=1 Tax=Cercophora scortea TaxID=314031 RepID=A0AAE0MJ37_9PEZI|nr:P-loop containing nucleoside triphosphate hydrolase protein [Cercophora scortea]
MENAIASPTCIPSSDKTFGPRIDPSCRAFDFTLLFEDVFFACLPSIIFLVLLPFHIRVLARSSRFCTVRSRLLLAKLVVLIGVFAAQTALLVLRSQHAIAQTNASLAADILSIVGIIGAAGLSYLDHQRSLRPSTLLSLYLPALVLVTIPRARTFWLMGGRASGEAAAMTATLVLTTFALFLESMEKRSSVVAKEKKSRAPEEYSGLWPRTAFAWLAGTFRAGYAKVLVQDDLPILDSRLRSSALRQSLVDTWAEYDHRAPHSLLKASFHANILSVLSAIPPRLCRSAFYFAQPLLINTTVSYVGSGTVDISSGRALIGAWALVFLGIACSTAMSSYQSTRFVTRVKGGLLALVYRQTVKARTVDLGETTAIALMGTDIERIGFNLLQIHEIWAAVIEIGVAIWLLEQQVFLACLAPVIVILLSVAINVPVSNAAKNSQLVWIKKVQERIRVTSTMLDDMKGIKMLGLSTVMSNVIQNLRQVEIQTSKVYRKLLVWNVLLSECPQNISPLATFAVNAVIALRSNSQSLLTAQAFTAIALINLLTNPVIQLVQLMPQLLQCVGSFERIRDYCNDADGGGNSTSNGDSSQSGNTPTGSSIPLHTLAARSGTGVPDRIQGACKHVITLENNSFTWEKSTPPFLEDITVSLPKGSFTICVGPVGSGKSMLLQSLLGETVCCSGPVPKFASSVAYCAQQPWLENNMIRSNIVGVAPGCDLQWYKTVVSACGLEMDIKSLGRGDQTVVGSKGINLSGGQKQRIALARAVYARTEVLILDDIFSGMDAHTVDLVSQRLLGNDGLLRKLDATVILATHSHKLNSFADTIITLENGRMTHVRSPQELLTVGSSDLDLRDNNGINVLAEDTEASHTTGTATESLMPLRLSTDDAHEYAPDATRKNGDWSVYRYYIASSGYITIILFLASMAAWIFCTEFPTVWLKWWSEANEVEVNKHVAMYMGVYGLFSVFGVVAIAVSCWVGIVKIISNSAFHLHHDLLMSTMRAPLRFFTTADTGSLTNRFSQDMELIDMNLPLVMINYISTAMSATAKAILLLIFSQYLATMSPVVLALLYLLQSFYLQTSRQVRLLEIEAKAPLYTHFIESVAGAPTIRAFGWQSHYEERSHNLIDQSQRPAYLQHCLQSWLGFVLDVLVAAIATVLVAVVVTWRDKFSAGNVGVSLVMVMAFSSVLMRMIKTWTVMEASIGAVARVKRFVADTESEDGEAGGKVDVPRDWPTEGRVEFRSVVAAHSVDAALVIKGLSFAIEASEHVAVCGRSGCGKTSTILALLQMIETREGQISIDGVDLSTMSCTDVRSHLNVVAQDPLLMPGTVRFNIDPFGNALDEDIIRALERVRLWAVISEQGGLNKEMDPAMWSAGQRQLLCLARAMVKRSRVLILDEATSSVDSETEAIMQDIIDTAFKDCTVIAVMHRLTHVFRYGKVAVLDGGHLVEFDSPTALLSQGATFSRLYHTSRAGRRL